MRIDDDQQIVEKLASVLDKTDWRKTIHKLLENCVKYKGTQAYGNAVERLIEGIGAEYPGWNAYKLINEKVSEIENKYKEMINKWINENKIEWGYPWVKVQKSIDWKTEFYDEVFDYVKNLVASKRMLLYGVRSISGGSEMPDKAPKE